MTALNSQSWPTWAIELDGAMTFQSQFVISGNVRDVFLVETQDGLDLRPILDVLWELASRRGYEFLLVYDPVDALSVFPSEQAEAAQRATNIQFHDGRSQAPFSELAGYIRRLSRNAQTAGMFVVDYASRLSVRPGEFDSEQHAFFTACEKLAHETTHLRSAVAGGAPPFNSIVWIVNRANDLPAWFVGGNETLRSLVAGLPDLRTRRRVADELATAGAEYADLGEERRNELLDEFTLLTEGMPLRSLDSIYRLAREQGFGLERIGDAVRAYKVGSSEDPWKDPIVRRRIAEGGQQIGRRVKGQRQAIDKTLDILMRSATGLSGAQAGRSGSRPKGVLFFAGPTGVGKTELAKALTERLFGDETAYHRFDMSEFSAEHSEARLIGAPPGYVGHDAGGELVNAVRQRPFSVLLFDEVEKAHQRILDKFLQILEDGRLTDGRGETVFFSESVIIFTSNLGIFTDAPDGRRIQNVFPEQHDYEEVRARVTETIHDYFKFKLERPELLNRIGDNIVVFDFIRNDVAGEIFDKVIANVRQRVLQEHGIELVLSEAAAADLRGICFENLAHQGGRGIGSRIETSLINPLARVLFERETAAGGRLSITGVRQADGRIELVIG